MESKSKSLGATMNELVESKSKSLGVTMNELVESKSKSLGATRNELVESKRKSQGATMNELVESKSKSLGATMTELVNIVSSRWTIPRENLTEVFPGIFIGDECAAKNVSMLKAMKVTHILNAAYSETHSFLYVNTSHNFYKERELECNFLGLSAVDCPTYKLTKYFQQATEFIDLAVNLPDGKILVHCRQGVSRSATFVIIYLMIKKRMTGREAVTLVRQYRNIFPNKGFLKEICDLESELLKSKHYDSEGEMIDNDNSENDHSESEGETNDNDNSENDHSESEGDTNDSDNSKNDKCDVKTVARTS